MIIPLLSCCLWQVFHHDAIRCPINVKNRFHPFFRKKDTHASCTFFVSSPKYLVTWVFILYHKCRCTTPFDFPETTEVRASSRHCFSYFTRSFSYGAYIEWGNFKLFWCGVSWIDDLVRPHLNLATLSWAGNFTLLDTKNLLRTVMLLWLKRHFTPGCPS